MTIWRIDANVIPDKGEAFTLPTFYVECESSEIDKRAMEIIGNRLNARIQITFGPLTTPRKSAANRYPTEGVWLGGLDCDDIYIYSEGKSA